MRWRRSHRYDAAGVALADRHYSRRSPGTPQYIKPGAHLALVSLCGRALWVTSSPRAEFTRHPWPGAWECSYFRNEGAGLSSELIIEAIEATRAEFGGPPRHGLVTWISAKKTKPKQDPGHCFRLVGFKFERITTKGLVELRLDARRLVWFRETPHAREDAGGQRTMFDRETKPAPSAPGWTP